MWDHVILYSIHDQAFSSRLIFVELLQIIRIVRHSYEILYMVSDTVLLYDCQDSGFPNHKFRHTV